MLGSVVVFLAAAVGPAALFPDAPFPHPKSTSHMGVYDQAAVAANGYPCASIGTEVLLEGGNAVDAAIATLLCDGVVNIHSMGVGGGFQMTIYMREKGYATFLNARERAANAAHKNMFHGSERMSQFGGLSVAIPGELKGYQDVFERYGSGNVTWKRLFQPTIDLCREGFIVTRYVTNAMEEYRDEIMRNKGIKDLLTNPETGDLFKTGDVMKWPKLADTLEIVAGPERSNVIYDGALTDGLVRDIQEAGGIITRQDFANYKTTWEEPVITLFMDHTVYTSPLPGSGILFKFMLNVLEALLPAPDEVTTVHRIVETFKFAYGRRTELGDMSDEHLYRDSDASALELRKFLKSSNRKEYAEKAIRSIRDDKTYNNHDHYGAVIDAPSDHGTSHLSFLDPHGNAVAVTSTINRSFGSLVVSPSTGILLNDQMDDFSSPNVTSGWGLPPSPANFIFPGKRPLTSTCPSIFINGTGDVVLVVGAAGGTTITTGTTMVAINNILFGKNIKEAIDTKRVHHQLFPMEVRYEKGINQTIIEGLKAKGHKVREHSPIGSTATGIARLGNKISACYDFRRGGSVGGF